MQQQRIAQETGSYGTTDLPEIKKDVLERRSSPFRTDVSVFALMWMMSAICMVPYALMADKVVCHIAMVYCFALSCVIGCLSWKRGRAWQAYSVLCFVSAGFGNGVGRHAWEHYPTHSDGSVNGRAVALCIVVLYACAVCALILGSFLPAWGYGVIGSSSKFAEERGWGWEPSAMQHMDSTCDWCGGSKYGDMLEHHMFPERVQHDLMYHRAYWSGEPALDYAFHVANDHLFLGCVFSHPASVFTKFDRVFVMLVISVLVVFPVAAFTVWIQNPLLRALMQALIVTLPRNWIKAELRKMSVQAFLIKEERDEALGSKFKRLVMKHFTRKKMMAEHEKRTLRYQGEAADSMAYFRVLVVAVTAIACYVSYLVIHLRDEDVHSLDAIHESMLIDGLEVTTLGILLDNMDGLAFAFTLELLINMMTQTRVEDGPRRGGWFVGFFGQWWHERTEFGRLRPHGRVFTTPRPALEAINSAGTAAGSALTDGPPSFRREEPASRAEQARHHAESALLNLRV